MVGCFLLRRISLPVIRICKTSPTNAVGFFYWMRAAMDRSPYQKEVIFMQKNKRSMTTKTLTYSALLAALSVVLARLFAIMPDESSRFSIEAVPIFLAGMLCGPIPGALVGFTADFVGCLFTPFGYNPLFALEFGYLFWVILRACLAYWRTGRFSYKPLRQWMDGAVLVIVLLWGIVRNFL